MPMLSKETKNDFEEIEFELGNTFSELINRYGIILKNRQLTFIKILELLHAKLSHFLKEKSKIHNCSIKVMICLNI